MEKYTDKIRHNCTYTYAVFIVCIELHVAHLQTIFLSCPHHIWISFCTNSKKLTLSRWKWITA